ncbi:ribonuclease H-like domain-containing protein [Circinella umbellata]|nr:ribonuclease H-like domain-containing protein [Circinella umbellata]
MKKKRQRDVRELQSQRQQNQVVIVEQENMQRQLEKKSIDQDDTLASGQKRKTGLERHDNELFTKQTRIEYGHLEKVSSTIEQQEHAIKTKPPGNEYDYSHPPPAIAKPKYVTYQGPYYSNPTDAPSRPKIFSGKEFRIPSKSIQHLKPVQPVYSNKSEEEWKHSTITGWEPAIKPPTPKEVREWLREKEQRQLKEMMEKKANKLNKSSNGTTSQLDGPSMLDFQFSLSKPKSKVTQTRDYLDILSVEIHINTRDNMLPDPEHDPVQTIFWCLKTEDVNIVFNGFEKGYHVEIITVGTDINTQKIGLPAYETNYVENEESLFRALIEVVRLYDPDMLVGYELHNSSWGYLIERATVHDINLIDELARVGLTTDRIQFDQWGYRKASVFRILGRHMINIWRLMKSEYNLTSYTFENLAYNILHCR